MFSGLNNFLKIILPKSLFYRSLIIVAAPTIILQIIITIVFFDSIWIKANQGMTRSLVGEIKTLTDVYNNNKSQFNFLTNSYKKNFDFVINVKNEELPQIEYERRYSPMDRLLRRELKSAFGNHNYWFNNTSYKDIAEIRIRVGRNIIQFFFPKDKITTSSKRLFVLWVDGDTGFEPVNGSTKSYCLTTWRIPIIFIVLVAEIGFEPMTFGL